MARGHSSWWLWLLIAIGVYWWYQSSVAATPTGTTGTPTGTTDTTAGTSLATVLDAITARGTAAFVALPPVVILPGPFHPWVSPSDSFAANVSPTLLDAMGNVVAWEPGGYIPVAVQQQQGMNSFLNPITPFSGPSGGPAARVYNLGLLEN